MISFLASKLTIPQLTEFVMFLLTCIFYEALFLGAVSHGNL
jgi:hypothetical protein